MPAVIPIGEARHLPLQGQPGAERAANDATAAGAAPATDAGATPEARSAPIVLNTLGWSAPFHWLAAGWRDFLHAPGIGLFYGACFMGMGWALMEVFQAAPAWTLALSAGFLLMGPFLCLGLYHVSRELEAGRKPEFSQSLFAWEVRTGTLAIFAFVLLVLEMLWGRASLIVFAVSFDGMPDFRGTLMALLDPENLNFIVAYTAVGAVFAGLIYAITAISMPMILDRSADAITAGLTSFRLVLTQTGVMLLWGVVVTALIVLAMLPWFAGLLVVAPVVGHATWHAYRAAVAPSTASDAAADR